MKIKKMLFILWFLMFILIPKVYGNPVFPSYHPENIFITFIVLGVIFMGSLLIEIFIIKIFLRRNVLYQNSKLFYKSIISVNLLTFIFTQLIALFVINLPQYNIDIFLSISILIELVPIGAEILLFLMIYNHLNEKLSFRYPIEKKTTILSTLTANLITFLIGIFVLYYYPNIL